MASKSALAGSTKLTTLLSVYFNGLMLNVIICTELMHICNQSE